MTTETDNTDFAPLTCGEWSNLPAGTVMERDDGYVYIVSTPGGGRFDPWCLVGHPAMPHDPVTLRGPFGRFRRIGDAFIDTVRALASLAVIERRDGRQVATVSAPEALQGILGHGTDSAEGQAAFVAALIARAAVYGKVATYTGEATMAPGFAIIGLRWEEGE